MAHALGMRVPPELDTDERVAAVDVVPRLLHLLPGDTPVPVIDVATQSESAPMPLGERLLACRACHMSVLTA